MFLSLHKAYNDCFDNGVFDRSKVIENKLIDTDYEYEFRIGLLESIFNIVLNSKVMNEWALEYITNGHRTYEGCIEKWNKDHPDKAIKLSSGKNKIIYSARRINELFDDIELDGKSYDIVQWLCDTNNFRGIENNAKKLNVKNDFIKQFNMFNEVCGEKLDIEKRDILLTIPTFEKVKELSDEEFDELMEVLRPYSKFVLSNVQNVLNSMEKEVGYLRFLMGKKSVLTDLDKERKNEILLWLGKEVIENYTINDNIITDENKEELEEDINDSYTMGNTDSIDSKNTKTEIAETEENNVATDTESDEEKKEKIKSIFVKLYALDKSDYILGDYEISSEDAIEVYKLMRDNQLEMDEAIDKYLRELEIKLDTDDEDDSDDDDEDDSDSDDGVQW